MKQLLIKKSDLLVCDLLDNNLVAIKRVVGLKKGNNLILDENHIYPLLEKNSNGKVHVEKPNSNYVVEICNLYLEDNGYLSWGKFLKTRKIEEELINMQPCVRQKINLNKYKFIANQ